MNTLGWIIVATSFGGILGVLSQWLAATTMTAKQIGLSVISAIVAVLLLVGSYEAKPGSLTLYTIVTAVTSGWGAVMGRSTVVNNLNTRKLRRASLLKNKTK